MPSTYNEIAGKRLSRMEALSDGVFAIAMTILVFDLKDPVSNVQLSDGALLQSLQQLGPVLLTYLLSFMTLGIFWTGQSTQFDYLFQYTRRLTWISLFFLLFVSLIPFTTAILSHHIHNRISILLYWLHLAVLGVLILLHWSVAKKSACVQAREEELRAVNRAINKRVFTAQALYALGASLCFIDTYLSIVFIIAVQLNYALGLFPRLLH